MIEGGELFTDERVTRGGRIVAGPDDEIVRHRPSMRGYRHHLARCRLGQPGNVECGADRDAGVDGPYARLISAE